MWGPWLGLTLICCDLLQEGTLWGFFAILSLLAGLATGTLRTPHCNETLDATPTPRSTATASLSMEDGVEAPLAAGWSQLYGECWDRTPSLGMVVPCVGRLGVAVRSPSLCGAAAALWGWAEEISTHGALCFMLGMWQSPRDEKMRRFLSGRIFPHTHAPSQAPAIAMVGDQEGSVGHSKDRQAQQEGDGCRMGPDSIVSSTCRGQCDNRWPRHRRAGGGPAAAC